MERSSKGGLLLEGRGERQGKEEQGRGGDGKGWEFPPALLIPPDVGVLEYSLCETVPLLLMLLL